MKLGVDQGIASSLERTLILSGQDYKRIYLSTYGDYFDRAWLYILGYVWRGFSFLCSLRAAGMDFGWCSFLHTNSFSAACHRDACVARKSFRNWKKKSSEEKRISLHLVIKER